MISIMINLYEMNKNTLLKTNLSKTDQFRIRTCALFHRYTKTKNLPDDDDDGGVVCFFVLDIEEEELLLYESE